MTTDRDNVAPASSALPKRAPTAVARQRVTSEQRADFIGTGLLLIVFAGALMLTADWSTNVSLVPRVVCLLGMVAGLVHLVQLLLRVRRSRTSESATSPGTAEAGDDDERADVDYVFATAGRAWRPALAWVVGFFVALYLAGLLITAPAFTLLYLRLSAQRTWRLAGTYAVLTGLMLYLIFEILLGFSTPPGLIFG